MRDFAGLEEASDYHSAIREPLERDLGETKRPILACIYRTVGVGTTHPRPTAFQPPPTEVTSANYHWRDAAEVPAVTTVR